MSTDGGQTFSPNFRITDISFDADQGVFTNALVEDEFYLGDFMGLAMAGGKAYAAWTDTRSGNQDIFVSSFAVAPLPEPPNDRFEPNNTPETTTELGRAVQRTLPKLAAAPGDEDWHLVEAAATGELIASALFDEVAQPVPNGLRLELWDPATTTLLATANDLVDDSGNVIGHEARFPAGAGDKVLARVVGPDAAPGAQTVGYSLRLQSLTADLGTRAYARVNETLHPGGSLLYLVKAATAGSIDIRLSGGDNVQGDLDLQVLDPEDFSVLATGQPEPFTVSSAEPNDSILEASDTGLVQPGAVTIDNTIGDGAFGSTSGDYDFFSFEAGAGQGISAEVNVFVVDSALDSMILLYDSAGNVLEVVDSASSGGNETLSYVTDKADTYYVAVAAWESGVPDDPFAPGTGAGAGGTGDFRLTVRTETIGAGAKEGTSLPIRQGEPVLLLVTGQDGSSGDFALEFTNLDQFTTPENATLLFPAGAGPSSVALGDLNLDANPDLVVPNTLSNTLSVLLGNADGSFQAPRQVAIGAYSRPAVDITAFVRAFGRHAAIADLNSDLVPDVVVTNYASSDVSVLLGRGDGTFEPQRQFDATSAPVNLDIGDLNGDGWLDLAVITPSVEAEFTVATLLGRGNGTFEPQWTIQVPAGASNSAGTVRVADLNRDGKPELAVAGHDVSQISILLGNGDGTFTHSADFDAARLSVGLAVVDINGDGKLDIANTLFDGHVVTVLFGNGDGTFQPPREFDTG